jgi:hypothetical protein
VSVHIPSCFPGVLPEDCQTAVRRLGHIFKSEQGNHMDPSQDIDLRHESAKRLLKEMREECGCCDARYLGLGGHLGVPFVWNKASKKFPLYSVEEARLVIDTTSGF